MLSHDMGPPWVAWSRCGHAIDRWSRVVGQQMGGAQAGVPQGQMTPLHRHGNTTARPTQPKASACAICNVKLY